MGTRRHHPVVMIKKHIRFTPLEIQLMEQAASVMGLTLNAFLRQAGRFWAFRNIRRAAEIREEIEKPSTEVEGSTDQ